MDDCAGACTDKTTYADHTGGHGSCFSPDYYVGVCFRNMIGIELFVRIAMKMWDYLQSIVLIQSPIIGNSYYE